MSKLLIVLLCLAVLAALAMAYTALMVSYNAMMLVGLGAFVLICVAGWLYSEFC
jgi:hypothetical protein